MFVPVVTAEAMAEVEAAAIAAGASAYQYMDNAGLNIAQAIRNQPRPYNRILFLVGKGNNGGDALSAAYYLAAEGVELLICHTDCYEACSPLARQMWDRLRALSIRWHYFGSSLVWPASFAPDLILDGLVGTGFKGSAEGTLKKIIQVVKKYNTAPVFSIDIPSGLCGSTGNVGTVALVADKTFYLEYPKWGFFVGAGWEHVGELEGVCFGLESAWQAAMVPVAWWVHPSLAPYKMLPLKRSQHKYQAGYLLGFTGSMAGASAIASLAALRMGAGLVRLFTRSEALWHGFDNAVIVSSYNDNDFAKALKRAQAIFLGAGFGRGQEDQQWLLAVLSKIDRPSVLDGGAFYALGRNRALNVPLNAILTPHRGELATLLATSSAENLVDLLERGKAWVAQKQAILICKGAPTFILHPDALPYIITGGSPGMAKAGMGDLLTGMVAALLAQ